MRKNTLTVVRKDPRTRKPIEMAKFTLDRKGKVKEEYNDFRFKMDMRRGIRVAGKVYKPSDGRAFMGALEKAYRASSFLDVIRS